MACEAGGWLHTSLCRMHLSFLLDLSGAGLEELLGTEEGDNGGGLAVKLSACSGERPVSYSRLFSASSSSSSSSSSISSKKHKKATERCRGMFGAPLTSDVINTIQPLFDFLLKPDNLQQEGLFRKTGHIGRQRSLRGHLMSASCAEEVTQELATGQYTAHDVASLLKTFLGEIPEPLLSERHYNAHSQIPDLPEEKQLPAVQLLIQLLPLENVELLRKLTHLLKCVVTEEKNLMTADTLATLFVPHIMVPRKMAGTELQEAAPRVAKALSFIITHPEEIFQVPEMLSRDLASSRNNERRPPSGLRCSPERTTSENGCTDSRRIRLRRQAGTADAAVSTAVCFTDRQATQQAAAETDTTVALAELYAHVSKMPDSSKKRKILKQFTKANTMLSSTPEKNHKRSRSFGESLKKMMGRHTGHKRRGSGSSVSSHDVPSKKPSPPLLDNEENLPPSGAVVKKSVPSIKPSLLLSYSDSDVDSAPSRMLRLFKSKLRLEQSDNQSESKNTPIIRQRLNFNGCNSHQSLSPALSLFKQALKQQQTQILPSSPKVHIVDMAKDLSSHSRHFCDLPPSSPCMSIHKDEPSADLPRHTSPLPQRHRLRQALRSRKSPVAPSKSTGRYEKAEAFVSPITRSMQRFPVSTKVHMMTPGSRQPMAVLHTP